MTGLNLPGPWYHGSPQRLCILRKGSWVTPFKEVAKAFSHKPSLMSLSDDCGAVSHDGSLPGFLYVIGETVGAGDVSELPGTAHTHWKTQRDLRVDLVAELPASDPPLLTPEEIADMKKRDPEAGKRIGFISRPGSGRPDSANQEGSGRA